MKPSWIAAALNASLGCHSMADGFTGLFGRAGNNHRCIIWPVSPDLHLLAFSLDCFVDHLAQYLPPLGHIKYRVVLSRGVLLQEMKFSFKDDLELSVDLWNARPPVRKDLPAKHITFKRNESENSCVCQLRERVLSAFDDLSTELKESLSATSTDAVDAIKLFSVFAQDDVPGNGLFRFVGNALQNAGLSTQNLWDQLEVSRLADRLTLLGKNVSDQLVAEWSPEARRQVGAWAIVAVLEGPEAAGDTPELVRGLPPIRH